MDQPIRIGVLGLTHDHVWTCLSELAATADGQLLAAADPNEPLLERADAEHGCGTYRFAEEMLAAETLDAVYVFGDNRGGVELVEMAAARGLHVLIEKPLAATLEGADRVMDAVETADVRLMVNWPFAWWPQLQHALTLAAAGEIGDVWQLKYRAAHEGPRELGCSPYFCDWLYDAERNGGGALMDYCCYGAALARTLLGRPEQITAVAARLTKTDIDVEDNAVIIMSSPRAMAIAESSWSQIGSLSAYTTFIYGTRGTLMVEPHGDGRLLMATAEHYDGTEVQVPEAPPHMRNASVHFLHCLATGEPFNELCQADVGRDAQEILAAGLRAAESGVAVELP